MIISAWWNLASSKLKKSEAKFKRKTWKQRQLLTESGFVLRIAPPSLSRDRRIKMKKSESNLTFGFFKTFLRILLFSLSEYHEFLLSKLLIISPKA